MASSTSRASTKYRSWAEFYEGRNTGAYRAYVKEQYSEFLQKIALEIYKVPNQVVLEVGCGLGTITNLLTKLFPGSFRCLDVDPGMVRLASANLKGRARVIRADMCTAGWFKADIIHGHGVLEHLSDLDIYRTLEAHREAGARVAIHYVPGILHGVPSYGDERLMPFMWWVNKWDVDEAFTFNGGKDYVLIWRF